MLYDMPGNGLESEHSKTSPYSIGLLAARAAIALDQRARGEKVPVDGARELGRVLSRLLVPTESSDDSRRRNAAWPLNTAALFQDALQEAGNPTQTFDELMSTAQATVTELANLGDDVSSDNSARLRDFCL